MKTAPLPFLFIASSIFAVLAQAQGPAPTAPRVQRKPVLDAALPQPASIARVQAQEITLGPRVAAGRHLHPVHVVGRVAAGAILFQLEGEAPRRLGPGDTFFEPAGRVVAHFDNAGEAPASFTAYYLIPPNGRELIRMLPAE